MIRVFVGCAPNGEDVESQAVLEYTLRKHASEPVEIVWMRLQREGFWSGWNTERWATPFSGFRWAIPAFCNFEGRAIYMDSDVIVCSDIAGLWKQSFGPGQIALAKHGGRLCVSLWDCAAAKKHVLPIEQLRSDPEAHRKVGERMKTHGLVGTFEGNWNCLDGEGFPNLNDPALNALHYTKISCQPHLRHALKRMSATGQKHWFDGTIRDRHDRLDVQELFDKLLVAANLAGYPVGKYIPEVPFGSYKKKSLVNYKG